METVKNDEIQTFSRYPIVQSVVSVPGLIADSRLGPAISAAGRTYTDTVFCPYSELTSFRTHPRIQVFLINFPLPGPAFLPPL